MFFNFVSDDMLVVQWQTNNDEWGWTLTRGEKVFKGFLFFRQKLRKLVINVEPGSSKLSPVTVPAAPCRSLVHPKEPPVHPEEKGEIHPLGEVWHPLPQMIFLPLSQFGHCCPEFDRNVESFELLSQSWCNCCSPNFVAPCSRPCFDHHHPLPIIHSGRPKQFSWMITVFSLISVSASWSWQLWQVCLSCQMLSGRSKHSPSEYVISN